MVFPIVSSSNCYVRSATLSLYFKIAEFFDSVIFYLQTLSCCNRICTCSLGTSSVSLDNMSCKCKAEETSFFSFDFYLGQTLSLHIKKHGSLQSWSNNIAKKKQIHAPPPLPQTAESIGKPFLWMKIVFLPLTLSGSIGRELLSLWLVFLYHGVPTKRLSTFHIL